MRLVCPACGAIGSLEAWAADAGGRQVLAEVCRMPGAIARHVPGYLALFRPRGSGRQLSWARALRLAQELRSMAEAGWVQRGAAAARPCPPETWAQALETLIDRPPSRLPLKSHGYLMEIAYQLADQADRKAEASRNAAERAGGLRGPVGAPGEPERLDPDWMRRVAQAKLGKKRP